MFCCCVTERAFSQAGFLNREGAGWFLRCVFVVKVSIYYYTCFRGNPGKILMEGQFDLDDENVGAHEGYLCALCESFASFVVKALNRKGCGAYAKGAK